MRNIWELPSRSRNAAKIAKLQTAEKIHIHELSIWEGKTPLSNDSGEPVSRGRGNVENDTAGLQMSQISAALDVNLIPPQTVYVAGELTSTLIRDTVISSESVPKWRAFFKRLLIRERGGNLSDLDTPVAIQS